jgi:hypothetical protein
VRQRHEHSWRRERGPGALTNFLHVLHDASKVQVLIQALDGGDALAADDRGAQEGHRMEGRG